jgi:hypothetical protein
VNCNYFIPNDICQQAYWIIGKICMRLAAGDAPVTVKRRALNRSTKVRTSLCNPSREGADHCSDHALWQYTRSKKKVIVTYAWKVDQLLDSSKRVFVSFFLACC